MSLALTMFQNGNSPIRLSTITVGGSHTIFFKIDTIGEDVFPENVKTLLDKILSNANGLS